MNHEQGSPVRVQGEGKCSDICEHLLENMLCLYFYSRVSNPASNGHYSAEFSSNTSAWKILVILKTLTKACSCG